MMHGRGDDIVVYRSTPGFELRGSDAESDSPATLDVTFARFGVWNEIESYWEGNFMELLAPGAFERTFSERGNHIRCLFDHGYDPSIGMKPLGTVTDLRSTEVGPSATVELFTDAEYVRSLLPALQAQQLGASYRFKVRSESWDDDPGVSESNPKGLPLRTITDVDVYEFGPVTFPADEGTNMDGMVAVRSLTDTYHVAERPPSTRSLPAVGDPGVGATGNENESVRAQQTKREEAALARAFAARSQTG